MKTETLTIRIDKNVKEKLQKLADENKRKFSDYIHLVLELAVEKKLKV